MNIAIVILNWNGKDLLSEFLPSVVKYSKKANIYLADNASTDDSVSYVKRTFPLIKIIQLGENYGYAKGYNKALAELNEEILCLLNSDIEVTENWLEPILNTFRVESNTAIIQPKLLDYNRKDHFEYAGAGGGFIDRFGYPYCRGRVFNTIEKDHGQYDDTIDIFWSSGACLFVKNSVFKELNGLDEAYFAHMEEIDLCWRARNLGYDIKYVGTSVVYHVGGATLKNSHPKKTYLNFRNSLFNLVKNAESNIIFLILVRLILDGIAALKFIIEFKFIHFLSIIRAHLSFYNHLPTLIRQRKSLSQSKKYFKVNSIVWLYFFLNKTNFNRL